MIDTIDRLRAANASFFEAFLIGIVVIIIAAVVILGIIWLVEKIAGER